jgi:ribosome biogenesis GTPase A
LQDHLVGLEYIADYLLFHLNLCQNFSYVSYLKLDEPMEDCRLMLAKTAVYQGLLVTRKDLQTGANRNYPDLEKAAEIFVDSFRQGKFGRVNLDIKLLERIERFKPGKRNTG